jgi:hypothetical protein
MKFSVMEKLENSSSNKLPDVKYFSVKTRGQDHRGPDEKERKPVWCLTVSTCLLRYVALPSTALNLLSCYCQEHLLHHSNPGCPRGYILTLFVLRNHVFISFILLRPFGRYLNK